MALEQGHWDSGGLMLALRTMPPQLNWNPAGIASVSQNYQVCLMHAARRSGLGAFSYISGIGKIVPQLTVGLSWIRAGY